MAKSIARLAIDLVVNSTEMQKGFSKAMKPINKFGREMTAMGKDLSTKVTLPILGMGAGILKVAGDFEAGMNRVGAITGATGEQFEDLRNKAKQLGATTQFSATEAAGGIEMLAKNGLKYQEIMGGALEATLKLSAATGSDLSRSADIATDAMLAFGVEAKNMEQAINNITGVTLNSKFDIEGYAYALANAGGVAASVGISFEDFNATVAAIAPSFSSGMTAGTSFKTFLARLTPTSDAAAGAMEQLGLKFFNTKGEIDDMATIAGKLQKAFSGLSEEDKLAKGIQIFGTEGVRAAFALMNAGADDIEKMKAALANTSAADQATARMKGLNGALIKMRSALEAVAIAIADSGLLEVVTELAIGITGLFSKLSVVNPEILKWGTLAAGAAASLGPLLLVVGKLALALGPVVAAISAKGGLVASLIALANPVTAAIAGIVALTAAYLKWKDQIDAFLTDTFEAMFIAWDKLVVKLNESADAFFDWTSKWQEGLLGWDQKLAVAFAKFGTYLLDAGDFINNLWDVGKRAFEGIGLRVQMMVAKIENWLVGKLLAITEKAGGAVDALKNKFKAMADAVVMNSYVPDMVDKLGLEYNRMNSIFILPTIQGITQMTKAFLSAEQTVNGIKLQPFGHPKVVKNSKPSFNIKDWFKNIKTNIGPDQFKLPTAKANKESKDFAKNIGSILNNESTKQIDLMVGQYERIGEKIGNAIMDVGDGLDGAENKFESFGKNILGQFKGILGGISKESKGFDLGGVFGIDTIGNIFSGGNGGFGKLSPFGGGGIDQILGQVGNIFSSSGGGFLDNILGGIGSIFGGFFANGGDPPVGKVSVVGEKGPELFVPKTAGTVLPNSAFKSVGGNKQVNITVQQTNHFEGGVSAPQVGEMLKQHGQQLVKSITDGIQRGGAFRQAFQ